MLMTVNISRSTIVCILYSTTVSALVNELISLWKVSIMLYEIWISK